MVFRDETGKTLDDYPRPSVAVDTAVLTVTRDGSLAVVLTRPSDDARWRLPGTFLHPGERLADAVVRSLHDKCGIDQVRPAQLHVFDDPGRDDRGWVLSVAHVAVVRADSLHLAGGRARVVAVEDLADYALSCPDDHREIVDEAVDALRGRYRESPDPDHLLDEPFTIRDLRRLHEAVAGNALPRDTFRRSMLDRLNATDEISSGTVGKPAKLYRRRER